MDDELDPVTVNDDAVRHAARTWLESNWNPETTLLGWRRQFVDSGWAVPSWDRAWCGRGLPAWADEIVAEELRRVGAVGLPLGGGVGLAAPTILTHGPDDNRRRFLRPILTGEQTWCQLFSEPGAGSDLAGLTTTAVRDGDRWILNGQKVWNTSAHHADFGLLVARTDWDAPKHRGLTYFALPMHQVGVEARPLLQMNRHSSFNEVFLTDAEIPADHVIGDVGSGWSVALTTLAFERRFGAMARPRFDGRAGRAIDEARTEADEHFRTYAWYPQRAGRVDLLADQAKATGRGAEPTVRQDIVRALTIQRASGWTAARAQADRALGRPPGAEGSIGKLSSSHLARQSATAHSAIAGAHAMLSGANSAVGGVVAEVLISVPAQSIAGGTDQIQRNIIGERVLGLPREPAVDTDVAYREVRRN